VTVKSAVPDLADDDFDPLGQYASDARSVRDPYPALAERRRNTPVARRKAWSATGESISAYEVYRFDDVATVMRDNVSYSSESIRAGMEPVMGPYPLVGMDEPDHKRLRSLVAQAFRQKSLAHWEDDLVVPVVDEMIDRFSSRGHAELVRELTYRYPVQVIATILGLPREDHAQFHRWATAIINVAGRPMEGIASSAELREYLVAVLDDRRRNPRADFLSDLVQAELDGERLGDEEIFSFVRLLLPAGAETTYRATGNLLFGLLTNVDQLAALDADRSLLTQAVEEAIRWETPLLITSRVTTVDVEVTGTAIPAGAQVVPNIGSANHDESRWENAEQFDLFREQKPIASFGVGPHMCLGMHLARMEMRTAVNRLFDRCTNLRFDPDAVERDDPHIHGETFRSPTTLPVVFDAEQPAGSAG
jgi:cytochrome P450